MSQPWNCCCLPAHLLGCMAGVVFWAAQPVKLLLRGYSLDMCAVLVAETAAVLVLLCLIVSDLFIYFLARLLLLLACSAVSFY